MLENNLLFGWLADVSGLTGAVTTAVRQTITSTNTPGTNMKGKKTAKNVFPCTKWRANMFEAYVGELYKTQGEDEVSKQFDPLWIVLLGLLVKYNIKKK
jgi:hypothetical protein